VAKRDPAQSQLRRRQSQHAVAVASSCRAVCANEATPFRALPEQYRSATRRGVSSVSAWCLDPDITLSQRVEMGIFPLVVVGDDALQVIARVRPSAMRDAPVSK